MVTLLWRLFVSEQPLTERIPPGDDRAARWGWFSVRWGLGLALATHLVALVVPRSIAGWNAVEARLYLLEGTGLAIGLWAAVGIVILGVRFVRGRASKPSWADSVVVGLVVVVVFSGIVIAVFHRFGSFWGVEVMVPYLFSLAGGEPRPELVADLPVAARIHLLAGFALVAVFPLSRWLAVPASYVVGAWQMLAGPIPAEIPPEGRRGGDRLGWAAAWVRGIAIVAYFIVATVWLPSLVFDRMADAPQWARDVAGSGVWLVAVAIGVALLRRLQQAAEI